MLGVTMRLGGENVLVAPGSQMSKPSTDRLRECNYAVGSTCPVQYAFHDSAQSFLGLPSSVLALSFLQAFFKLPPKVCSSSLLEASYEVRPPSLL